MDIDGDCVVESKTWTRQRRRGCDEEVRRYGGDFERGWMYQSRRLTSYVAESGLKVAERLGYYGRDGAASEGEADAGVVR